MPSFAVSICVLTLVQSLLVALPRAREIPALARFRSGFWAAIPVLALVVFIFGVRLLSGAADGIAYLALVTVPPLAALALAAAVRGSSPWLVPICIPLFALAWIDRSGLAGEAAGLALDALSGVTLAVLLVAVCPRLMVKLAIVVTAAIDTWLVASSLINAPNRAINAAVPVAHLPQLQSVAFGRAGMGYEDLFIAALLGAVVAAQPRLAALGAAIAALVGLAMDLLFLLVSELPATVPIALALLIMEATVLRAPRHVVEPYWKRLPNPEDHPTFRLDPPGDG